MNNCSSCNKIKETQACSHCGKVVCEACGLIVSKPAFYQTDQGITKKAEVPAGFACTPGGRCHFEIRVKAGLTTPITEMAMRK